MGLPAETLPIIMAVLLAFVVVYTMLGGMVSVVLTDVFQFVVITIGIILTSYFAFSHAGGTEGMISAVREQFGSSGFNLWEAPKYGLLFMIWTFLYYMSGWSSWQPVVQRTLSMQNVSTAMQLFRISSLFMFFRACLPMLWGIAALAVVGVVADSQTALPEMLVHVLPAGLVGFIVVGFLAASMSTYDSYLLSFSAILVQDVCAPLAGGKISEQQRMLYTRGDIGDCSLRLFLGRVLYIHGNDFPTDCPYWIAFLRRYHKRISGGIVLEGRQYTGCLRCLCFGCNPARNLARCPRNQRDKCRPAQLCACPCGLGCWVADLSVKVGHDSVRKAFTILP